MSLHSAAFDYAKLKHNGQLYGDYPYICHLIGVEKIAYEFFGDVEHLSDICYLHDIIEDTDATFEELLELFGNVVATTVNILTKKGEHRDIYIENIKASPLAHKCKVADTFYNLQESIKGNDMNRIRRYTNQLERLYK